MTLRKHAKHIAAANRKTRQAKRRRGAATLDYILVMGIILPLAAFLIGVAPRMMNAVYQMTAVLFSWPFM